MEYLPFGKTLIVEHLNSYNSPFKFNAKELDEETGNYYYGARYYNPKWSIMLSVDQMSDKYPSFSPYAYTLQNPVKFTDPTGMVVEESTTQQGPNDYYKDGKGNIVYDESINSEEEFKKSGIAGEYIGKTYTDGDTYFGLFGEVSDLNTLEGKLAKQIDQTIINYGEYYSGKSSYERATNFNLGEKFNGGVLSGSSDNLREFNYNGANGYYHIYGSKDAMYGMLDRGNGNYSKNSNYGKFQLRNGWNVSIYNTKSMRTNPNKPFNIINLVFPTQKSYDNFDRKIDYEFFGKQNPSPIKKIVLKSILD